MPRPGPSVTSGADLQPGSDSLFPSGFTGGGAKPSAGSVGTGEIADGSVAAADLNLSSVATALAGRSEFTGTYGPQVGSDNWLKAWAASPDALIRATTITRDANGAATSASVVWPDGTAGTYTGTASATILGAIDSYTVTYVGTTTKTVTQPTMTRDAATGGVTNRPALTVA